ncbi:hypothetical protein AB733_21575 [Photobacterium swingsii]|nr:site-specific integrase [Photobacterium swingsii]KMV28822.1 hypothetical protein AB733_21575 [Photobacterium swingsii]
MALTDRLLKSKSSTPEGAHKDYPDGGGLLARKYKTGAVAFYYRYRWSGKQAIVKIGTYPEMPLKQAREKHQEFKRLIDSGVDPRRDKQRLKERITFKEGIDYWYKHYVLKNRKECGWIMAAFKRWLYPTIGNWVIEDVNSSDWISAFQKITAPMMAKQLFMETKGAINYLIVLEIIDSSKLLHLKMKNIVTLPPPTRRIYTFDELRKMYNVINNDSVAYENRAALLLVMFFGCRIGELRRAKKSDFNLKEKLWTVPVENSKNKTTITRPVPDFLVPVIKQLMALSSNDLLIHGRRGVGLDSPAFSLRMKRAALAAGIDDFRAHGFRHTISTRLADMGVEPYIAEKLLGHKMAGVMAVYNQGQYIDQINAAMNAYHDKIIGTNDPLLVAS